eukprot:1156471-Pelagomonas_calceolata.AAC.3
MPYDPFPQTPLSVRKLISHPLNWPTKRSAINLEQYKDHPKASDKCIKTPHGNSLHSKTCLQIKDDFHLCTLPIIWGKMKIMNCIALICLNPTINGMHTNRHRVGLSFCVNAISKGRHNSSLIGLDACRKERLLDQCIGASENVSRTIPGWVFPNGTGSSARHHCRPDAVLVRSIPGQSAHPDPTKTLLKTGTFILLNLNSALIPTLSPLWRLPSMLALEPGSKPAAQETQTGTTR